MSQFTFVDLFAGIGGFHLALAGLGGRCVLASEIDPECQRVYRSAFPDTPVVGGIRELPRDGGAPRGRERVFVLATRDRSTPAGDARPIRTEKNSEWTPKDWRIDDFLDEDSSIAGIDRYVLRSDERRWLHAWNDVITRIP